MNKSDLVQVIAQKAKITKGKAELVVDTIFNTMKDAILKNARIEIRGFGSFANRQYNAYKGRNPRTGRVISIKQKKLPFFKVGKELRNDLNKTIARKKHN